MPPWTRDSPASPAAASDFGTRDGWRPPRWSRGSNPPSSSGRPAHWLSQPDCHRPQGWADAAGLPCICCKTESPALGSDRCHRWGVFQNQGSLRKLWISNSRTARGTRCFGHTKCRSSESLRPLAGFSRFRCCLGKRSCYPGFKRPWRHLPDGCGNGFL